MATINKIQTNGTTYDIAVSGSNVSGAVASADTLTGLTATVTELNYMGGVTSNVQTQIDNLGKSVADGKELLATAISNGPIGVASDATFSEMVEVLENNIDLIASQNYDGGYERGYSAGYAAGSTTVSAGVRVGRFTTGWQSTNFTIVGIDTGYNYAYIYFAGETPRGYVIYEGYCVRGYTGLLESHAPENCSDTGVIKFNASGSIDITVPQDAFLDADPGVIILSKEKFTVPSAGSNDIQYFY